MPRNLRCSFCGKGENDVARLVAGPDVYICDGCVRIATDIIEQDRLIQSGSPASRSFGRRLLDLVRWPRRALEI